MDTKAAFDREAFAKEHGMTMEFVNWFFDEKAAGCGQVWFMMAAAMWEGWKASRAAIEIKLPNPEEYLCNGSAEAALIDVCSAITSHGIAVISHGTAITSHGIRIKGKTE
ncbi:hypothetical protein [Rahnella sp. ChDrAdgB13]|uniref:hypothetical protein n=1 Tax=Rahnella sp. ChDrAdgB13 TaxID=1850581 RepID=UPI001AD86147|nr:hypothetical protein [Rahnella sp. ChDrAdgB13]